MPSLPHSSIAPELYRTLANVLRPAVPMEPSEWAERYRVLPEGSTESPGPWRNNYFPYLAQLQDCCAEAIRTGKNFVMMKSAQGGGSDAIINVVFWLLMYYPGPLLYLISTDIMARKFGRERIDAIIDSIKYLQALELPDRRTILEKRFAGFKLSLRGSQSIFGLQSEPFRHCIADEVDSMQDAMKDAGDPLAIMQQRQSSYRGAKLTIAFAHPTSKQRGAGYLYYNLSDQRRGFVTCPHAECRGSFYLQWSHVKAAPRVAGQLQEVADRDPHCYSYHCPHCAAEISDAQRWVMIQSVEYRSLLTPEEAAKRTWIGFHFSQLYYPNKSILELAQQWVNSMDKETERIVFIQKTLGEPYEPTVKSTTVSEWRKLSVSAIIKGTDDPELYHRGQVPRGVQYLTGGVDSRFLQLHWTIWGWGLRRSISRTALLCGWLIDFGIVARPKDEKTFSEADYSVFDETIFKRAFVKPNNELLRIEQCGFDTGFAPTQIPIHRYCRRWPHRAIPIKGGSDTSKSNSPFMRNGSAISYTYAGQVVKDESLKVLNTYTLKTDFFNLVDTDIVIPDGTGTRKLSRLLLPKDEGESEFEEFLKQSSSERLKHVPKKNYMKWIPETENHLSDCNIYNYALAQNLDPYARPIDFDEPVVSEPRPPGSGQDESEYHNEREESRFGNFSIASR